jgi:acyl-CoA reductase-like NAD-dependent aldehyde dehydrogenase
VRPEHHDEREEHLIDGRPEASTSFDARVEAVERVGALTNQHREELVLLITAELGMPLHLTRQVQVDSPARAFGTIGTHGERIDWEQSSSRSTEIKEPVGVVGAIEPWNFPFGQGTAARTARGGSRSSSPPRPCRARGR